MMKIEFIGPPGSGKGTHARMLSLDMGIPLVSLGDIIRDEVERKTKLGKKADVLTYKSIHPLLKERILREEVRII